MAESAAVARTFSVSASVKRLVESFLACEQQRAAGRAEHSAILLEGTAANHGTSVLPAPVNSVVTADWHS